MSKFGHNPRLSGPVDISNWGLPSLTCRWSRARDIYSGQSVLNFLLFLLSFIFNRIKQLPLGQLDSCPIGRNRIDVSAGNTGRRVMRMVRGCRPVWVCSICCVPSHVTIIASRSNNFGGLLLSNGAHLSRHINSLGIGLRTVSRVNRTVKIGFCYSRALQKIVIFSLFDSVHIHTCT